MSPEILQRLADFERRHKPDSKQYLAAFREEIVALHFKGYSLKKTFQYLKDAGVGCSLRTFERWVKENIDFTKEHVPEAARRARQAVAPEAAAEAPAAPLGAASSNGKSGLDSNQREAALAQSRELREKLFERPVERALDQGRKGGTS